jgi:hypothetical protein
MILFLRKAYSFIKAYWYVPAIIVAIIAMIIAYRKVPTSLWNVLLKRQELHQREVEEIQKIHDEEIEKREQALKTYHETIKAIEEKYEEDSLNLTNTRKKEIKKIIEETNGNSDLLAKRLADQMGFEIVYPKE